MRLTNIELDDDEKPAVFTFKVTLDEAALLYRLTGHIAPLTITERFGDVRWGNALVEIAEAVGAAFNRFFDAGPDEVIPRPTSEA